MQNQFTSTPEIGTIEALLAQIDASENPQLELLKLTIERTRKTDPPLADAIWYCAIPRRFDATIIGVLRSSLEDTAENQRIIERLREFPFVLTRTGGDQVYHDTTRDLLLQEWRTDKGRRREFDEYNLRLVSFYEGEYETSSKLKTHQDWERVSWLVQKANPERVNQLASIVDASLFTPILEALYHEMLRSAEDGYRLFGKYCEVYEANGRITQCISLLNTAKDYLRRFGSGNKIEQLQRWFQYWEARLTRQVRGHSKTEDISRAQKILFDLLPHTKKDIKLQLWTLGELDVNFHDEGNPAEARKFAQKQLALAERTRNDPYNLPVSYSRVASIHWSFEELAEAEEHYRKAIDSAQAQANLRMEMYSRLDLSGTLQDQGRWSEALQAAFYALHSIRTELRQNTGLQRALAQRLMLLAAAIDSRLVDTMFAECMALTGPDDSSSAFDLRDRYIGLLYKGGQLERAERELALIEGEPNQSANTSQRVQVLSRKASLLEEKGWFAEAAQQNTKIVELLENQTDSVWEYSAALTNRGWEYLNLGRLREAAADLRHAASLWKGMRHSRYVALAQVYLAATSLREGRLDSAEKLLASAGQSLQGAPTASVADYNAVLGDSFRYQANWFESQQYYLEASRINQSVYRYSYAAKNLADLASVDAAQGRWEQAARHSADADLLWRRLSEMGSYRPTDAARRADEENAQGLLFFSANAGERNENLLKARDLFRSACGRAPENFWYHLNLSYACSQLNQTKEGIAALRLALELAPESMRSALVLEVVARTESQDVRHYWSIDEILKSFNAQVRPDDQPVHEVIMTRKAVRERLDKHYHLSAESAPSRVYRLAVTPIAVEIAQGLLPLDTGPDWPLLKTDVPEMRARVERDTGVPVPGLRFRGNEGDLPAGSFIIMLDEIPLVMASVQPKMRYSPASPEIIRNLGVPPKSIVEERHPVTGAPGCWVEEEYSELVVRSGVELWNDPLVFMVYYVESLLRRNLADFLGIQEVENLLESWAQDKRAARLIRKLPRDSTSRRRLARVLRELVKEGVPVTNWKAILSAVRIAGLGSDDAREVVEAVRLRLKSQLPGNENRATRLELPQTLEEKLLKWISRENGKVFLAMPPEETQKMLAEIREMVSPTERNQVLVAQNAELRPFVHRLIELEFPNMAVLSNAELLPIGVPNAG